MYSSSSATILFILFYHIKNKISSTLILLSAPCLGNSVVHRPLRALAAHSMEHSYSWRNQSGYWIPDDVMLPSPGMDVRRPVAAFPQALLGLPHWRWDVPQTCGKLEAWHPIQTTPGSLFLLHWTMMLLRRSEEDSNTTSYQLQLLCSSHPWCFNKYL